MTEGGGNDGEAGAPFEFPQGERMEGNHEGCPYGGAGRTGGGTRSRGRLGG